MNVTSKGLQLLIIDDNGGNFLPVLGVSLCDIAFKQKYNLLEH